MNNNTNSEPSQSPLIEDEDIMKIIILGTGCAKCKNLEAATRQAISEMDLEAVVSKEEDIVKIMQYGVMQTPGLVINGKVVSQGKLLTNPQLREIIEKNQ